MKLTNIGISALDPEIEGSELITLGPEDIVDGNLKLILGMVRPFHFTQDHAAEQSDLDPHPPLHYRWNHVRPLYQSVFLVKRNPNGRGADQAGKRDCQRKMASSSGVSGKRSHTGT